MNHFRTRDESQLPLDFGGQPAADERSAYGSDSGDTARDAGSTDSPDASITLNRIAGVESDPWGGVERSRDDVNHFAPRPFQPFRPTTAPATPPPETADQPSEQVIGSHTILTDDSDAGGEQGTAAESAPESPADASTPNTPDADTPAAGTDSAESTPSRQTAFTMSPPAARHDETDEASEDEIGPTGRPRRPVPDPTPLDRHGPATVIAVCNQKGGVGKTTSTINLGAALAECGRRVLLVDLDPQGALSAGLGVAHQDLDLTIYNALVPPTVSVDEILMRTRVDGLDLLPSNIDLSAAEIQLVTEVGREQTLARALHPVLDRYDYVLIDCQPSLGLLTVNALACADTVLIPMECEYFSLRGLALLTDTVDKVRDRLNPRLTLGGILVTMFDARTLHSREVMARVVEVFGDKVYDTVINRTVRFPETSVAGEPITSWAPKSAGAAAYRALAHEVIYRNTRVA